MDYVERWLYPVEDIPTRHRTRPMGVLALGLSRSGTDSLRQALEILGHEHVYHGFEIVPRPSAYKAWTLLARKKWAINGETSTVTRQDFDAIIGHCTAVTDVPCAIFALEMIEAYPEAQVILNTRDLESWHRSVASTLGVLWAQFDIRVLQYFNARLYWRKRSIDEIFNRYFYGSVVQHGKMKYREHCAVVRGAVLPQSRLLEWRVQDGWEPLCKFLDVPVPDQEFPNGNRPKEMMERVNGWLAEDVTQARHSFYIFCSFVMAMLCCCIVFVGSRGKADL